VREDGEKCSDQDDKLGFGTAAVTGDAGLTNVGSNWRHNAVWYL